MVSNQSNRTMGFPKGKPVILNKDQLDGIAKVLVNLATACAVSAIASGYVDKKISWLSVATLTLLFALFLYAGAILRNGYGENNDN